MSRLETSKFTLQEELPPELLRRLQVEELWARRTVLSGLMNAERLRAYADRRTDLAGGCAPMDVMPRDKLIRPAATVLLMKNHKSAVPRA
jgi:hypothetical protein